MTIRKRKHKSQGGIKFSWSYDFYDIFKKRHQKSGFKTKPEAEQAQAEAMQRANAGRDTSKDKNIKFREVIENFISLYAEVNLKPSTIRSYKDHYRLHIKDFFKDIKLVDINTMIISKLVKEKQKEGLSNKTINNILTSMGTVFNWAIENGYIMFNPVQRIKKLKVIKEEMQFLTKEEIDTALEVALKSYPDFYPLLLTAIYTGMRRGELLGLTWDYVNFKKSTIKVKNTLYKGKLSTPKTKTSLREIHTPSFVMSILKELKENAQPNEMNLVFIQANGKCMDADNMIKRRFNKVLDEAGIAKIRFHDLRHTYASLLLAKDVNIKYIQKQMGHASFEITMNTYAHLMPEVYVSSEVKIDELI